MKKLFTLFALLIALSTISTSFASENSDCQFQNDDGRTAGSKIISEDDASDSSTDSSDAAGA